MYGIKQLCSIYMEKSVERRPPSNQTLWEQQYVFSLFVVGVIFCCGTSGSCQLFERLELECDLHFN